MSGDGELVIGDISVRFVSTGNDQLRVVTDGAALGTLAPLPGGDGYSARSVDGQPLTRASQWGGRVTARFGTKELAVRALLSTERG